VSPRAALALARLGAALAAGAQDGADPAARVTAARARLAEIDRRADGVADINALENLQRIYGYYTDKMLWEQVLDLFADDATLEIGSSGVYVGKASIRGYLYALSSGREGPIEGVLYDHMQLQPIVTVADGGSSARARWRALILTGVSGSGSGRNWGEGVYENEYVKQGDVWKISKLRWHARFIAPYEGGWLAVDPADVSAYSEGRGVTPDRPPSVGDAPYPSAYIPPVHFPNPVSEQPAEGDLP
jgi:hypothetical protein